MCTIWVGSIGKKSASMTNLCQALDGPMDDLYQPLSCLGGSGVTNPPIAAVTTTSTPPEAVKMQTFGESMPLKGPKWTVNSTLNVMPMHMDRRETQSGAGPRRRFGSAGAAAKLGPSKPGGLLGVAPRQAEDGASQSL